MSRDIRTYGRPSIAGELLLPTAENGRLLFTRYRNKLLSLLLQGNRLMAVTAYELTARGASRIGAIYVGKVKKVIKNIDACFVEIAKEELCFLPLSECSAAFLTNRVYDGRILEGDEIVVQVTQESIKTKQPAVTTRISISGSLMVLSVGNTKVNASVKLSSSRKKQLLAYLRNAGIIDEESRIPKEQELSGIPPFGLVIRTEAGKLEEESELLAEYVTLRQDLADVYQKAEHRSYFSCLVEAPKLYQAAMKQVNPEEYTEIVTDIPELFEELTAYIRETCKSSPPQVRFYQDDGYPLSKLYSIETKLKEVLSPRVWLKSGGYLVIEPTEALTVIDVNTGKYDEKKKVQDTFFRINLEAAEEIARQLRLRNLSGIIIIDFINMQSAKQQETLLQHLEQLVRQDRIKTKVVDITPLGLVEVTRKKLNKALKDQLT